MPDQGHEDIFTRSSLTFRNLQAEDQYIYCEEYVNAFGFVFPDRWTYQQKTDNIWAQFKRYLTSSVSTAGNSDAASSADSRSNNVISNPDPHVPGQYWTSWVAEQEDKPIGYLLMVSHAAKEGRRFSPTFVEIDISGPYSEVQTLIVAPQARGNKVGETLLLLSEARATELGSKMMVIKTRVEHREAVRLYDKHGYICNEPKEWEQVLESTRSGGTSVAFNRRMLLHTSKRLSG